MPNKHLESLEKTGYGWLTPGGEMLSTPMYGHFNAVSLHAPEYADWIYLIHELAERFADDKNSFIENVGPDEHPGWHMFHSDAEGLLEEQRNDLMTHLYQSGWVRLGTRNVPKNGKWFKVLHAEGGPTQLKIMDKELAELSDRVNSLLVKEPTTMMKSGLSEVSHAEVMAWKPDTYSDLRTRFEGKSKGRFEDLAITMRWSMGVDCFPEQTLRQKAATNTHFDMVFYKGKWVQERLTTRFRKGQAIPPQSVLDNVVETYRVGIPSPEIMETIRSQAIFGVKASPSSC